MRNDDTTPSSAQPRPICGMTHPYAEAYGTCDKLAGHEPTHHGNEHYGWPVKHEPKELIIIPGSLNEHTIAHDLVEIGNVNRAIVMSGEHVSFEAWRVSPTSYAWRTPSMSAPAFGAIERLDTRPDVHGMPRWEWDLYGMVAQS